VRLIAKRKGCCCSLSVVLALNVWFTTKRMCIKSNTQIFMWREQAIIEWSRQVISIVACCNSVKLCALAAWAFWSQHRKYIFPCLSHAQYVKMTRDEHALGFGFKSCDISTYWWMWMLSFLLNQIWIGIDYFLLNFIATFGSILGLQATIGL